MFSRILIANRGEIALRIIRAAREMGIETVAVYSQADRDAGYLSLADEAICIGPAAPAASYLNIASIIAAAEVTNVDAIHPGYGFLAENSHFVEICQSCKIQFIGPNVEAMSLLGDKVQCKQLAIKQRVPTIPGSRRAIESEDEAVRIARDIGYPVMLKAAAGGGGRGMRVAHNDMALRSGLKNAMAEAETAFGDGSIYVERYLETARHVEVQIAADQHGAAVHLFERDCTMQRRHQKLIEEAPCPVLSAETRAELCKAAVRLIKAAKYDSVGTVEFLVDDDQDFYLLEVNTRVQVEHPVTEMITGLDIVKLQIRAAAGEPLGLKQSDIKCSGHAIEVRVNAEDSENGFTPQPGRIDQFVVPGGPGVRVETHCRSGHVIPPNYDSLIGKLIVHQPTRAEAIASCRRAVGEFVIEPIKTTIPLHQRLLSDANFVSADVDIHYVERMLGI
ncbi:MAG: acetyl-CoA carboxylase biotin carboxylase subunit [Planctomycetaceae bacterium]|nr:acetyl-CoA carboxylase biotin carboxylase subunit [Planctomycetaceae bacterium]